MGLDVSHDAWSGAYSAFMRFRLLLCKAAGYELVNDPESSPNYPRPMPALWSSDRFPLERYEGEGWDDDPPEDPLVVLIVHSDCDGMIPHKWALSLAERLEGLAPKMPEEGGGHLWNPREQTYQFARGLRKAHDNGEDVTFG